MKKTNLLLVIGLSLIIGGSALNITANFNNEETKTTQPKKANENLNYFELTLNQNGNSIYSSQNNTDGTSYYNMKQEFKAYNQALNANLELINQNTIRKIINEDNSTWNAPILGNEPTINNTTLIKYQITPYKSLYESKTEQKIITNISINGTTDEDIIIKYKITALTSTQDWSTYINQANWNTYGNNRTIINEIQNPENQQLYNESIEIKEITLTNNAYPQLLIETNMQILDNNTTYHFILIEPYISNSSGPTYQKIKTTNGYLGYLSPSIPPKITGYIIPNVENYEVIDLPGLLFNILTMPFAFISTAFNITLFPGTPFQINLSNLFLTIMAILIFVFIVKLFIGMKG